MGGEVGLYANEAKTHTQQDRISLVKTYTTHYRVQFHIVNQKQSGLKW